MAETRTSSDSISPITDPDRLLSFEEGRQFLGLGERKTWELVASGDLPHLRIGRLIRFRRAALVAWCEDREQEASKR